MAKTPSGASQDPSKTSAAHDIMADKWTMMRTLMRGTGAMRDAGEDYLPKFTAETDDAYEARLARTVLANFFEDAIRNAASLPFRKPVTLSDGAPEPIKLMMEDVDLKGQDLTRFANYVLQDGILAGFSFILVDFQRTEGTVENLAQEKSMGLRPYWVHLKADDVLAVYSERINGVDTITHLRYLEEVTIRNGFEEDTVRQVRVYEPGLYQIWREDTESKQWTMIESGPMSIGVVPIVPIICGRQEDAPWVVKPLFLDLAHKQIEHWQSSSDQRNILTFSRFPMLAVAGAGNETGEQADVGPGKLLSTTDPSGKWYFVEAGGAAIEAGRKDLETIKEEMRILGLQPQIGETGSVTATARALDETRVHSAVQVIAVNLEDALNQAIYYTGLWLGIDTSTTFVSVNRDFGISLRDASEIDALLRMRVAGELSRRSLWSEFKRRNVLSADFDADREEEALMVEQALGIFPMGMGLTVAEQSIMGVAGDGTGGTTPAIS